MNLLELFAPIKTFVFDVDGVMTDGSVMLNDDGHLLRTMHMRDNLALQMAVKYGYNIWIITEGKCEPMRLRLNKLGIREVHLGIEYKKDFLKEIMTATKTQKMSIRYMGDDIQDYAAMQESGLPCCPADAVPEIKEISKYISPFAGGKGCVRDIIEKVLKLNNQWILP